MKRYVFSVVILLTASLTSAAAIAQDDVERVLPSTANPLVQNFDNPNIIINGGASTRGAPLVVFLPGTNGGQQGPMLLMRTVAEQGYRVIYLPYNDVPAVAQICPQRPPQCSANFRLARIFGGQGPVSNSAGEGIVSRLVAVIRYLDQEHPEDRWKGYLTPDGGSPVWPRIVVSGLSQGAGMAALLAKRFPVNRVVLFSSPWDEFSPQHRPAPWLFEPSATPPWRWWAERHARENTTILIAQAYEALGIPSDHLFVFDGPHSPTVSGNNPFHGSTVYWPGYTPQWRVMFGKAVGH